MRELRTRGIRLWCSTGGSDEDTPMGRFMTDLRLRFGALHREQIADRTKMNRDQRLREGYWSGHAPTGYVFVDENGAGSRRVLVPDPETAPKVKALFTLMADGVSQKKAAQQLGLNEPTVIWQRSNPLYIGLVYKHHANLDALLHTSHATLRALADSPDVAWIYPGQHEGLIEPEVWDSVQRQRRQRTTRYGLSGAIRCGSCGKKAWILQREGRRSPRFRCRCGWEKSYRIIEATILQALVWVTESDAFAAEMAKAARDYEDDKEPEVIAAVRAERRTVSQKLERALDALLDAPTITDSLRGRIETLQEQKAALDTQLGTLVADHEQRRSLRSWRAAQATLTEIPMRKLWEVTTPAEQRALLPAVFSSILADKDGMCFQLRGMEVEFKTKWITPGPDGGDKQVAGPGIEPGTP
ncbi:MAG: recombinase family protein [Actinobacteria bacterium]|nr:recombinase family protein [Actinomycetota bacterium]